MNETANMVRRIGSACRGDVLPDEPLFKHTSYRIGGPADVYVRPADAEDVTAVIALCRQEGLPLFVIGNGSNLLISDDGLRGVVMDLSQAFGEIAVSGHSVTAGAGVVLNRLVSETVQQGLRGLEALAGIPGQVGGGLMLNAGAFGSEITDHLIEVRLINPEGETEIWTKDRIAAGYRVTHFPEGSVLMDARFVLEPGERVLLHAFQQDILKRRRLKQPLSLPSAGSVFKRPPGDYAGRLIEEAGCKGLRIGDAMVSRKHANFIVNTHRATASDVIRVIAEVRERVCKKFDITLETEIHFVGFEDS